MAMKSDCLPGVSQDHRQHENVFGRPHHGRDTGPFVRETPLSPPSSAESDGWCAAADCDIHI